MAKARPIAMPERPWSGGPAIFVGLGILAWLASFVLYGLSRSAVHEIEAILFLLIGCVFVVGGALWAAVMRLREEIWHYQQLER